VFFGLILTFIGDSTVSSRPTELARGAAAQEAICMHVYLYIHIYLSIYIYIHLSICLSICLSIYLYLISPNKASIGAHLASTGNRSTSQAVVVQSSDRHTTHYRAAREPLPRVPTAFQGSKCVRGGLERWEYQVKARCQVRANALLRRSSVVW